ncbi:MAG: hypothetical protein AAF546_05565 [Verrucomicrobiota bacterium]
MKIAVVGHRAYFENHYPEHWRECTNTLCLNVNELDYGWLNIVRNFRPDVTLFYRPEIYPKHYLDSIRGLKVAFMTEPVPSLEKGALKVSLETQLRMQVYQAMDWDCYDVRIFYDESKRDSIEYLGYKVDYYSEIPIDSSKFKQGDCERDIDVVFVGKPTVHRISQLAELRLAPVRYLWIAHGVYGGELASIFQRSKFVLNIHADGMPAVEPRVFLAAASGARVISEPIPHISPRIQDSVIQSTTFDPGFITDLVNHYDPVLPSISPLGVREFISDICSKFQVT